MSHASTQQGFTLIEVLVALTLMALVSLISWRGLDAVQQAGERLDERSEEALALVRALGQIERDLLLHAGRDVLTNPTSARGDGVPEANTATRLPVGINWDPQTGLSLVRSVGDGLWQQLHWYLHDGKLMRAAGMPSYLLPLPVPATETVVLEQVEGFGVRLWLPGQGWSDPQPHSQDGSPSAHAANTRQTNTTGLESSTTGLEIALFRRDTGPDKPYRKVVLLP